jgi:hypothetical protein
MPKKCLTHRLCLILLCLIVLLPGCAQATEPAPTALPTPKSQWVNEFILQEDSKYGYSMLRPASWQSADEREARVYFPNPQDDRLRLLLTAVNLNTYQARMKGGVTDVRWSLYRRHPDLESWTDDLIKTLYQRDIVQLEHNLDNARVYSVRSLKFSHHIQLVAFIADQSTPIEITLNVGGQQEDLLEEIRQNGIMDDFITIVESVHASP